MIGRNRSARRLVAVALAGVLVALPERFTPTHAAPAWSEVTWPFGLDPWPSGRVFACPATACGADIRVTLRPKIGFCNCSTGVSDDDELDRVGDLYLLGPDYLPDGTGWPLRIGTLIGRARRFVVTVPGRGKAFALGFAVAVRCDVVVGLVSGEQPLVGEPEAHALEFVESDRLRRWVEGAASSR